LRISPPTGNGSSGTHGSAEDRELSLRKVMDAFSPNNVIEIAHRTYAALK
jgi:hypothetical protein